MVFDFCVWGGEAKCFLGLALCSALRMRSVWFVNCSTEEANTQNIIKQAKHQIIQDLYATGSQGFALGSLYKA